MIFFRGSKYFSHLYNSNVESKLSLLSDGIKEEISKRRKVRKQKKLRNQEIARETDKNVSSQEIVVKKAKENVCEDFMLAIVKAANGPLCLIVFLLVRFHETKPTKTKKMSIHADKTRKC